MTAPHDPPDGPRRSGFSRRSFLKGSAAASVAGAGLVAATEPLAPRKPETYGPGEHEIKLRVNGQDRLVKVETRTTLLDALRDGLDLTGAKKICDRGSCGGCTVLVEGETVNSCLMLAMDAVGHDLQTVESLGENDPLIESFVHCDALQCGFCTPGMVMSSLACLNHRGQPTKTQMAHDLSGNLCRCGTYGRVMEAIERTAKSGKPAGKAGGR
ncbi:MAG: (2Fe-2S)-binding protein [Planctomycetes bacterium]|nr:(2Fe-2S)-binding protein [Planctomycetota bacterium]